MSSTYQTPTALTKAAAVILHQSGKFLRRINRQFDAQTPDGRKAGGVLRIRMPNQFTVRSGSVMDVQDTSETYETLTLGTQKGVDLSFHRCRTCRSIEDISRRILEARDFTPGFGNREGHSDQRRQQGCRNMVDDDGQRFRSLAS